jgi:hypothetical protein
MYVVLKCCVHNIICKCAFFWLCGCRLHSRLAQNATSSTPSLRVRWLEKALQVPTMHPKGLGEAFLPDCVGKVGKWSW